MFEAKFEKVGKCWAIEAPLLDVATQGKSKTDALAMLADAIQSLVNKDGFAVIVTDCGDGAAIVSANDGAALMALALRRQRVHSGQSLAQVSAKLGQKSRNAYARYEQGKATPAIDRLDDLFRAVAPGFRFVFRAIPEKT